MTVADGLKRTPDMDTSRVADLVILAGSGSLPCEVASAVEADGGAVHIVGLRGVAGQEISAFSHSWTGLGQVARMLRLMRASGAKKLLIIGGLVRPNVWQLRPDLGFVLNLATVAGIMRGGDDAVLRRVIAFFQRRGLKVVGVRDVAPALLAAEGPIVGHALTSDQTTVVARAEALLNRLSHCDMGQATVASGAGIVALEDGGGTKRLLDGLAVSAQPTEQSPRSNRLLVKRPKLGQDLRVDLPTIGPDTITQAARAGCGAIVVSAQRTLIAERARTVEAATAAGVAIHGVKMTDQPAPSIALGARARQALKALPDTDRDVTRAAQIVLTAWPEMEGDDFGVFVRRGHAMACLASGLSMHLWGQRLAPILGPQWHWVRRTRRGTFAIALSAEHMRDERAQRVSRIVTHLSRLHTADLVVFHEPVAAPVLALAGLSNDGLKRQCAAADIRLHQIPLARATPA